MTSADRPLRIALLAYRGKPHCGGQGVYIRHLAKALVDLGHHVEVFGGQPYPELDERVALTKLPSLDIYNDHFPMRMPGFWEVKHWTDVVEIASFSTGTFPEPLAFTMRAWDALRERQDDFDLVHDNQSLGYGLLAIKRMGLPVIATIHHPITVDRRLEMEHATSCDKRLTLRRWYAFTNMQTRVASRLDRVITVSENSFTDISHDHEVDADKMHIVPVGVDPDLFRPVAGVTKTPGMLITTASADVAMKGLRYLLEAVAKLRTERPETTLTVIGKPKEGGNSARTIAELGLENAVTFVSGVTDERIVELYSEAEAAVVPSLYEGFSLPAIEAMSCAVPLVATTGGAIPEVVGPDGETAFSVPPADSGALAAKIAWVIDHPDEARAVGEAGRQRVIDHWSWRHTAEKTVEQYRALLAEVGTHRTMLTVDFTRLGLEPGDLVLDMGAGAGRHAFEVYRRGAHIIALDYSLADLKDVSGLFSAMAETGEVDEPTTAATVNGDGTGLPFPDNTFDHIICSEVMEHIPDDAAAAAELARVLKPGGTIAVTVPTWLPEKICWAINDEYHAPFVEGGHVRIFTEAALKARFHDAGLVTGAVHHAHALHSAYWWLKCAVGPTNDTNPLVQAYHRLLVWDITRTPKLTRWTEKVLNPVLGKSLVLYSTKPEPTHA